MFKPRLTKENYTLHSTVAFTRAQFLQKKKKKNVIVALQKNTMYIITMQQA